MANRSTYVSARQHTRIRFTPLTWSCVLQCVTPQSPMAQKAYLDLEVSPDRTQTPCCIAPVLTVYDADGVMDTGGGSKLLSAIAYDSQYDYVRGHEWYVDGQEISSVWTDGTDYEITYDTSSGYNGMLTVYKNLTEGDAVTLSYRGVFTDTRLAMNRVVTSGTVVLECLSAGGEEIAMTASPCLISYDPLRDGKLLDDYLTGEGVSHTYAYDGQEYGQTVTLTVLQGMTPLEGVPDGYSLVWVERSTETELTGGEDFVTAIDGLTLTLDLRCCDDLMLEARLVSDDTGVILCRAAVDVTISPSTVTVGPKSTADIGFTQETYRNEALVRTRKATVGYPEAYFDIKWYYMAVGQEDITSSDESSRVLCGNGQTLELDVESVGMDKTSEDGAQFWMQIEMSGREACARLADTDGEILTDDDGNELIA